MKMIFAIFMGVFLISVPSLAAKLPIEVTGARLFLISKSGDVKLKNSLKKMVTISSLDKSWVEMKSAPFLKFWTGYKMLLIKIENDEFQFMIPRSSISAKGEFRVHQKYTGQNYNIESSNFAKDLKSVVSEKVIDCTYTTSDLEPRYTTDSDGNSVTEYVWVTNSHSGRQKAVVNDQDWLEKQMITIYDDKNQIRTETPFAAKHQMSVVKELTTCR